MILFILKKTIPEIFKKKGLNVVKKSPCILRSISNCSDRDMVNISFLNAAYCIRRTVDV